IPPSNCLASSSRSSHSAAIFRNPLTAAGLSRFTTSLLERSAGWSHINPGRGRLRVAILPLQRCTPTMEHYIYIYEHPQALFQKELADLFLSRVVLRSLYTVNGKTTLANIVTEFIPDQERIVLIEDTAEIQIQKPNVLRFEARREQNGISAVTIRDLLKATLRHRPDRIILGEIRGGEAFDLLQLLNTG